MTDTQNLTDNAPLTEDGRNETVVLQNDCSQPTQ